MVEGQTVRSMWRSELGGCGATTWVVVLMTNWLVKERLVGRLSGNQLGD